MMLRTYAIGRRVIELLLVASCLLMSLTGAAYAAPNAALPELVYTGSEFMFMGPDHATAGWTGMTFVNNGKDPHQANLARLHNGKTFNDLLAAFKQGVNASFALVDFVGGPNTIDPGGRQRVVLNLQPGSYAIICFVPDDQDGIPHVAKGMIMPLQVSGPASSVPAPQTDGTITLKDFAFGLPAQVAAGHHLWSVTNMGPQPHELSLLKLAPGKTFQDVGRFMQKPSGAPPFQDAGGMGGLAAGKSGIVALDLTPGNYVALCFIPDPKSGKPHFMLGMVASFSVRAAATGGPSMMPNTGTGNSQKHILALAGLAGLLLIGAGVAWRSTQHA